MTSGCWAPLLHSSCQRRPPAQYILGSAVSWCLSNYKLLFCVRWFLHPEKFIGLFQISSVLLFCSCYQNPNFRCADKLWATEWGNTGKEQKCQELFWSNFLCTCIWWALSHWLWNQIFCLSPFSHCDLTICPWLERSPGWLLVIRVHICCGEGPRKVADSTPLSSNPFRGKKKRCSLMPAWSATGCLQTLAKSYHCHLPLPSSYRAQLMHLIHLAREVASFFSFIFFLCVKSNISQYSTNQLWQALFDCSLLQWDFQLLGIKISDTLFWVGQFVSQWHESIAWGMHWVKLVSWDIILLLWWSFQLVTTSWRN